MIQIKLYLFHGIIIISNYTGCSCFSSNQGDPGAGAGALQLPPPGHPLLNLMKYEEAANLHHHKYGD